MVTLADVANMISTDGPKEFHPTPFFDAHTDSFIYYAKDVASYANRLNSRFTLFLNAGDKSLVGFEIKGFLRLVHRMKQFDLFVTSTTVSLEHSIAMAIGSEDVDAGEMSQDEAIESITMFLRQSNLNKKKIDTQSMQLSECSV